MNTSRSRRIPEGDFLTCLLHGETGRRWWNDTVAEERRAARREGCQLVMDFGERNYDGLNFSGFDLDGVSFSCAKMMGTNLREARMCGTDLSGVWFDANTDFTGTKFSFATSFLNAALEGCNLSRITGRISASQLAVACLHGGELTLPNGMSLQQILKASKRVALRDGDSKDLSRKEVELDAARDTYKQLSYEVLGDWAPDLI